jgi:hypothetical protein
MKKEKTVTRVCKNCNQQFTIITAKKVGCHYEAVKGWHSRRYCRQCQPNALYKDHAAYMRMWYIKQIHEDAKVDNSV